MTTRHVGNILLKSSALWRPLFSLHGHYLSGATANVTYNGSKASTFIPNIMSTAEASTNTLSPQDGWSRSDLYHNSFLIPEDESLDYARKNSDDSGLPSIDVTAAQGKLLNLIARSINAKRILEVGTLGGCVSLSH